MLSVLSVAQRVLPAVKPGRALSDHEWAVLVAVAEAMHEGSPVNIDAERVANNVEAFLVTGRSRRAVRVRLLCLLIEASAIPVFGKPFSHLSLLERRRMVTEKFAPGRHVYRLCAKVRYLVVMGEYGDPAAVGATGYVPVMERRRFRELARPPRVLTVSLPLAPQLVRTLHA